MLGLDEQRSIAERVLDRVVRPLLEEPEVLQQLRHLAGSPILNEFEGAILAAWEADRRALAEARSKLASTHVKGIIEAEERAEKAEAARKAEDLAIAMERDHLMLQEQLDRLQRKLDSKDDTA